MKYFLMISIILAAGLLACNQTATTNQTLQNRIDTLEKKLSETYKPGLGEFMSGIQIHHAKLWFAGLNQNWKLADFEINEIKESVSAIEQYCTDRPESKVISMIDQPIDSLGNAVALGNLVNFKNSYIVLTNTCNSCHKATGHEFNVITIPSNPPFSNQDFKLEQ